MKKISIIVPCYNEKNSIQVVQNKFSRIFMEELKQYDYEIIYVDDCSTDNSRELIKNVCNDNKHCKAVFNARNFGFHRNVFESFKYADGDAVFMDFGDLQDPPEMLPEFVKKWEDGYKCIVGQRIDSDEHGFMKVMRIVYYDVIDKLSQSKQIRNMNGYGLYDRKFVDILASIEEVSPYFKAVINEYGIDVAIIQYKQTMGYRKKSNFNFLRNYDFAMHGITSSTKLLMRIATFIGAFVGIISLIMAAYVFIRKLIFWNSYPLGTASLLVGIFFIGSIQLFFIGVLGEYVLSINERVCKKPRVIIERTINMDNRQIKNIDEVIDNQ